MKVLVLTEARGLISSLEDFVLSTDFETMLSLFIFFALTTSLASSASVDIFKSQSLDPTELATPRFIEKSVTLLTQLFKAFTSMKEEAQREQKVAKLKYDLVPYDGLSYYDPTYSDWHSHEKIKEQKTETTTQPTFWVFDNFSKKVDLITLTKVILKIIVFKKIVKFIALVCLLFFLPTLNDTSTTSSTSNNSTESHEERSLDIYGKSEKF